jgi:hypothetical protein
MCRGIWGDGHFWAVWAHFMQDACKIARLKYMLLPHKFIPKERRGCWGVRRMPKRTFLFFFFLDMDGQREREMLHKVTLLKSEGVMEGEEEFNLSKESGGAGAGLYYSFG